MEDGGGFGLRMGQNLGQEQGQLVGAEHEEVHGYIYLEADRDREGERKEELTVRLSCL